MEETEAQQAVSECDSGKEGEASDNGGMSASESGLQLPSSAHEAPLKLCPVLSLWVVFNATAPMHKHSAGLLISAWSELHSPPCSSTCWWYMCGVW